MSDPNQPHQPNQPHPADGGTDHTREIPTQPAGGPPNLDSMQDQPDDGEDQQSGTPKWVPYTAAAGMVVFALVLFYILAIRPDNDQAQLVEETVVPSSTAAPVPTTTGPPATTAPPATSQPPTTAPPTTAPPSTLASTTTSSTTTTAPAVAPPPVASTTTSTTLAPTVTTLPGDLNVAVPISKVDCNGQFIAVVTTADGTAADAIVQQALQYFPGSNYLQNQSNCKSLPALSPQGNPIYSVYLGPFPTAPEACAAGQQAVANSNVPGATSVVAVLDDVSDPNQPIAC